MRPSLSLDGDAHGADVLVRNRSTARVLNALLWRPRSARSLFERVQGFGIWYESETGLIDSIVSAARRILGQVDDETLVGRSSIS